MRRRRKKVRKPFFTKTKIIILSVALVVFIGIYAAAQFLGGISNPQDGTDGEFESADSFSGEYKETGKVTFLLVGVDRVASLSDTIMVACYDLDKNEVNVISVPRDTRMYIGSKYQKINSAYGLKSNGKKLGVEGVAEAVKRLLGISKIDYYIDFNLTAFSDIVDALGGVDFDVPQNMKHTDLEQNPPLKIDLKKGKQHLDGDKAEQLIRFRGYAMGDIKRVEVQQDFIKALMEQHMNVGIITKIPELYDIVKDNIKTNLEVSHIVKYATQYVNGLGDDGVHKINMYSLPGEPNDTDYGHISYWIPHMDETKKLVSEIFGVDASKATIHSADGSSVSKDVKSPKPTSSPAPDATTEPTASPKPSQSPSATPKPTASPKPSQSAEPTKTPETSIKPTTSPSATPTPDSGGIKRPSAN